MNNLRLIFFGGLKHRKLFVGKYVIEGHSSLSFTDFITIFLGAV
jgi:hypothetical protein